MDSLEQWPEYLGWKGPESCSALGYHYDPWAVDPIGAVNEEGGVFYGYGKYVPDPVVRHSHGPEPLVSRSQFEALLE
jgi:hypothetical protein